MLRLTSELPELCQLYQTALKSMVVLVNPSVKELPFDGKIRENLTNDPLLEYVDSLSDLRFTGHVFDGWIPSDKVNLHLDKSLSIPYLDVLERMNPEKFAADDLRISDILYHHRMQRLFARKIKFHKILDESDFSQLIREYQYFLQIASQMKYGDILIPSLREEFVWQAHLLDHDAYMAETAEIFKEPLQHHMLPLPRETKLDAIRWRKCAFRTVDRQNLNNLRPDPVTSWICQDSDRVKQITLENAYSSRLIEI